jgi:hypothetical protein
MDQYGFQQWVPWPMNPSIHAFIWPMVDLIDLEKVPFTFHISIAVPGVPFTCQSSNGCHSATAGHNLEDIPLSFSLSLLTLISNPNKNAYNELGEPNKFLHFNALLRSHLYTSILYCINLGILPCLSQIPKSFSSLP